MLEFNYHIPTKIQFGPGSSQLVGQVIRGCGKKKPLIVTDEGVINSQKHLGTHTNPLEGDHRKKCVAKIQSLNLGI